MEAAHVERRELLERRRREVNTARRTARASVNDLYVHGLAVGAGDDHLAAAHRVPVMGAHRMSTNEDEKRERGQGHSRVRVSASTWEGGDGSDVYSDDEVAGRVLQPARTEARGVEGSYSGDGQSRGR